LNFAAQIGEFFTLPSKKAGSPRLGKSSVNRIMGY